MKCSEIGSKFTRQDFVDYLNSVRGGQFFHLRGYVNSKQEKADYWLRFGIKYGNLKDRDIQFLRAVRRGEKSFNDLNVTHGVWVPDGMVDADAMFLTDTTDCPNAVWAKVTRTVPLVDAELVGATIEIETEGFVNLMDVVKFGNRKAAGRTPVTLSYTLSSTHPLVVAAIGDEDLQDTVLQGLVHPRETGADFVKEAKSCYSLEKEGMPAKWYLRDVLIVAKVVRVKGKFSASLPLSAVKDAIRSDILRTGKYRQFVLTDGQFEAITIEGVCIMCDGIDEEFYVALPEDVRAAMQETASEGELVEAAVGVPVEASVD